MGERFRTSSPDLGLGFASRSSELSIVLCCNDQWKKNSVVNTILGRTHVTPNPTIKTEGEVEDRHVVFVSSPDWAEYSVQNPWKHVKQQIEESVSLCPPGPHAFLMVIPLCPFREAERREVEERLELFYECIWRRSIVLFSGKARLGGKTVEKYIKEEPCLQQLIQKCGNRYHVLSTENREELLETIDVMVTAHRCASFQMMEASEEIEEKKAVLEENAKQRLVMAQKKRATLRKTINEAAHRFSDITMVLLGRFCAGKCSTGNNILGKKAFDTTSNTLECVVKQSKVNGRMVTVVLTPGWNRDFSGQEDQEDTPNIKDMIKQSESLCPSKPHAFLLVIHCDSSFTETDRRRVEEHLSVLGEEASERTLVLFTWGDRLGETAIEMHIERWNKLRWLVDKCGNWYHVLDNTSTDRSQVGELLEKVDEMLAESKHAYATTMYQETKQKNRELKEMNQEKDREVIQVKKELELRSLESDSKVRDDDGQPRTKKEDLSEIMDVSHLVRGQRRQGQPDLPSREDEEKQTEGEQELQREEKKLRNRHRTELEELEREFGEDSATKTLDEAIQKLFNRLKGETGVPMRELEEELKRKLEKKAWVEKEERRRREEKEIELKKRHRREMEALRQLYSEEPRQDGQGYLKPGLAVLGAVIGGIAGALRGPGGVAGGTTLGAVVGAQLGAIFGGGDRPREKRGRERRKSMDEPGRNF